MGDGQVPHISIAAGIIVGLIASAVQSFGLTLQRKSHLQNESLVSTLQKSDYKRPLWITGFLIFICSNLLGTIFQIGALPIVVLGPLGAVSLLYNAFFAKVILGDKFSIYLVAGTILIAGGAILIGIFGVVPEETHSLKELIALYSRSSFIIWITFLSLFVLGVLTLAHLTEWSLERKLSRLHSTFSLPTSPTTPMSPVKLWKRRGRGHSQTQSSPNRGFPIISESRYGTIESSPIIPSVEQKSHLESVERKKLILGLAYGTASGTLSGLCLLFAKTGVELLILTVVGDNQFNRIEAWLIVLVLIFTALAQLFYLNRALRLVGPTLICPLAFCFYNLSSIISGLIYYNQWNLLSTLQFILVSIGTIILLTGVWIVSLNGENNCTLESEEMDALLTEEPEELDQEEADSPWYPRGLSIGIGSSSPGFDVRPAKSDLERVTGGDSPRRRHHRESLSGSLYTGGLSCSAREEESSKVLLEEERKESNILARIYNFVFK